MQLVNIAIAGSDPQVGTKGGYRLVVKKGKTPVLPSPVVINEKTVFSFDIALYDENNNHIENLPPNMSATYTVIVPKSPIFNLKHISGLTYQKVNNVAQDGYDYWRKSFGQVLRLDFSTQIEGDFSNIGEFSVELKVVVKKVQNGVTTTWTASEKTWLPVIDAYFQPGTVGPKSQNNQLNFTITGWDMPRWDEDGFEPKVNTEKATNVGHAFFTLIVEIPNNISHAFSSSDALLDSLIAQKNQVLLGETIGWRAAISYGAILRRVVRLGSTAENIANLNVPGKLDFDAPYGPNGKYYNSATIRKIKIAKFMDVKNALAYANNLWMNKELPLEDPNRKRYILASQNCANICIEQGKYAGIDINTEPVTVTGHVIPFFNATIQGIRLPGDIGARLEKNYPLPPRN
jgi:hypothetical protein